ncbi:hypothetical protein LY78DRAFT_41912 [Colletotrichum sublineola]|nr:hypothetical protein LY78DRAFT_41912 [Colletotrichum sublineola]
MELVPCSSRDQGFVTPCQGVSFLAQASGPLGPYGFSIIELPLSVHGSRVVLVQLKAPSPLIEAESLTSTCGTVAGETSLHDQSWRQRHIQPPPHLSSMSLLLEYGGFHHYAR